jgi:hypothetical protein
MVPGLQVGAAPTQINVRASVARELKWAKLAPKREVN